MKIKFSISNDTLMAVDSALKIIDTVPWSNDTLHNVHKSIGAEMSDKFDKKTKAQIRSANLFDSKKQHKFTVKFYQAWSLHQILIDTMPHASNTYQQLHLQKLIDILNQKLI